MKKATIRFSSNSTKKWIFFKHFSLEMSMFFKKKLINILFTLSFYFILSLTTVFAHSFSPIGLWQTIDDHTGKAKSIVKIWQEKDKLYGKVTKIIYSDLTICEKCQGSLHNQPILGMVVMSNLIPSKKDPLKWVDGTILDPKNGKTYRAQLTLMPDGKKLKVRGYIGISLLGRTQTWNKVD